MKRTSIIIIPVICLILAIFAAGCSKKTSVFEVSSSSDTQSSITAESAKKGSSALSHMTIQGKRKKIVLYEKISREDAQEITVSGKDSAKVDGIDPGSYTVLVTATDDLNGTAVIR